MAIITGATSGNLVKPVGAYTQPLVNLTSSLPKAGQFASQIKPIQSYTSANNVVRTVTPLPVTQAAGQLGGQFGNNPQPAAAGAGGNNLLGNVFQGIRNLFTSNGPSYGGSYNPTVPASRPNQTQIADIFNQSPAGVGGRRPVLSQQQIQQAISPTSTQAYNISGGGATQADMQARAERAAAERRRQQINQLTTPYTGPLAAITGGRMLEPSQTGFVGTDYRQPNMPVSNQYVTGNVASALPPVLPSTAGLGANDYGYGGYDYGSGYYPYGGYGSVGGGGGGAGGDYSVGGNMLNWRVATG